MRQIYNDFRDDNLSHQLHRGQSSLPESILFRRGNIKDIKGLTQETCLYCTVHYYPALQKQKLTRKSLQVQWQDSIEKANSY